MKQVLSPEQMQTLIDKGVYFSGASMCWVANFDDNGIANDYWIEVNKGLKTPAFWRCYIPTFDLSDIVDKLPKELNGVTLTIEFFMDGICHISYKDICGFRSYNPLESAYQMLLWCIDNNHDNPELLTEK